MAFLKKIWKDRQSEHPSRRKLIAVSGSPDTYEVERAEGLILEEGEPFDAKNMNDLENRIEGGFLESGLCRYAHAKSKTVHQLTGPANAKGISFAAAVDFSGGDTFTVNGVAATARTLSGDPLWAGYFKKGSVVVCYKEGNVLTFSGGGGLSSADQKTVKDWMVEGHSVLNGRVSGSIPQITADGSGYVAGTGNVTEGEVWVQPPRQSAYYSGARWLKGAVPQLTAANLRAGVQLPGGLSGIFTADATASAGDLLAGKTAYVNGSEITGRIPQVTADSSGYVEGVSSITDGEIWIQPPNQNAYYSGMRWLRAKVPALTAANLRKGVSLPGGLSGTFEGPIYGRSYCVAMGNSPNYDSEGVCSSDAVGMDITYNYQTLNAKAYTATFTIKESGNYGIYLNGVVERYVNKTAWSGLVIDRASAEDEAYSPIGESPSGYLECTAKAFNRTFHKWLKAGQTIQGYAQGANETLSFASVDFGIYKE